jgi:hypothetical protein
MNKTLQNGRLALAAAALMMLAGTMGYGAARARGASKTGPSDRKQVAAIAAERDSALTALADAQMRLRLTQRVIQRYTDELAHADKVNEELRRELESRPAGGHGGLSAAGPMQ